GAMALVLAIAGFAAIRALPHLREPEATHKAVPATPRPVLAILGFRDGLASAELDWLPTAVSEGLGHELAAAETSLRVIPGDRVDHVRRSLGVSEEQVTEAKARERMEGLLRANVLVYGTLRPMGQGSTSVKLSVEMMEALGDRQLLAFETDLGEGARGLMEKLPSVA